MVNTNQSENENEELKLSPLGTDEINSVIKSFKNSTFNCLLYTSDAADEE